ncbi:adenylate/guanylate cyclase domain-containing protein [Nannocystis pusilla]|uniref:Adenylate/guanylate cyclase domain-containing protein n=1 Tax=Nannocystis pusilla TaxID=889268 RepID=A0ABS7TW01_9BACT|nr:adenylate/guanylate cyclase domain-containing protein [Nannocystis pusilla]MBZ5712389.1 adenylate/guanylate cyclase domain-containing protein [Nannocystis pusilla]
MDALSRWILTVPAADVGAFLDALARRAQQFGLPLWRMSTGLATMHPEVGVLSVFWTADAGPTVRHNPRSALTTPFFLSSPMHALMERGVDEIRCRLSGPDAQLEYPICRELAEQGGTAYLAWALTFSDGRRTGLTLATRAPDGFADEPLAQLRACLPALAVRLELFQAQFATRSLLQVYLGDNAARRVLSGEFLRGSGTSIRAAIWICDLRGFTGLSDRRPPVEVVAALDAYFERVVEPIAAAGGEVLKFIGDAVLAIFPSAGDEADACRRALTAARGAVAGLAKWNAGRPDPLAMGVALHVGDVFYGNIGGPDRLDFTVIGGPVNEVCRLEPLCKTLDAVILMTAAFRARVDGDDLVDLGEHTLRGVGTPTRVFGVRPANS